MSPDERTRLEKAMDKYQFASERLTSAEARGRLANAHSWRQMRDSAVDEMRELLTAVAA